MPGILGWSAASAAAIALIASLAACDSGKDSHDPGPSLAPSSSTPSGSGTATVTVGTHQQTFDVMCTQNGVNRQGIASAGSSDITLTVQGNPRAAVLVTHGSDGSTTIYQALPGLRDDAGRQVGKLTVSSSGKSYSGTGTFVLTKIDPHGKRVRLTSDSTVTGTFTLSCPNGYADLPVPPTPTKPPTPAKPPTPTKPKSAVPKPSSTHP
jgi:hypothetical protein